MQIDPSQLPNVQSVQPTDAQSVQNAPDAPNNATPPVQQSQPAITGATLAPGQNQPQQPSQSQPGLVSNAPAAPPDLSNHPSVQRAGILHTIAETLAGGPRYQLTPNDDGTLTRTRVPLSKGDLAMALAMEAISGSLAGLAQRGPGAGGAAAEAGFQQVSQQRQQADQEAQQQAQQDATNKANALVRQGQVYEQNSRVILNTAQAERYGIESLKDAVNQNAQLLSDYEDAGAILAHNVPQDTLREKLANGEYSPVREIAVPDGFTSINGKYEQTFSIVADPRAKVPVTQEQAQAYGNAGVQGWLSFANGKTKIPDGFTVPGTMIANANQQMQAISLMKSDYTSVVDALSQSSDKNNRELAKSIPSVQSLLSDPNNGPAFQGALLKFQKYVSYSDMHGQDFYQSLTQMSMPSKPSPQNPKQYVRNPDAPAAQTIAGAFGNGDPQKGWAILKAYHDETTPETVTSETQAESVLADPNASSRARVQARNFLSLSAQQKAVEAGAEERAKKAVTGADASGMSDPSLSKYISPANIGADGVNHAFLNGMQQKNPERAALIQSIGQGRTLMSKYGLNRKDGQALAADVNAAFPNFDQNKVEQYESAIKDFAPGGKSGKNLIAANTALTHLQRSFDNVGLLTSTPGLSAVGSWLGVKGAGAYKADVNALASEIATAYKGGVPDKEEVSRWYNAFTAVNPNTVRNAYAEAATLLLNRVSEMHDRWDDSVPSSFVAPTQFVTDSAAQSFKHVTGQDVPSELRQRGSANPSNPPAGATMQVPGSDGKLHWSDGKRDLGVVQ